MKERIGAFILALALISIPGASAESHWPSSIILDGQWPTSPVCAGDGIRIVEVGIFIGCWILI